MRPPEDALSVKFTGGAPVVFTAPHGVYVRRETVTCSGEPVFETHLPEKWSSFLALEFAWATGGASLTWSEAERERSKATRTFNPEFVDPNCVAEHAGRGYNWGLALSRFGDEDGEVTGVFQRVKTKWFHVDIHGRRDPAVSHKTLGYGDIDIGTRALSVRHPELASKLTNAIGTRLRGVLGKWATEWTTKEILEADYMIVNETPVLSGARDDGFLTLSQQGVKFGLCSVQLELSLRLRLVLKNDKRKAKQFALGLVEAWKDALDALENSDESK